nr:hypothetical protein [uncultured bacterium]
MSSALTADRATARAADSTEIAAHADSALRAVRVVMGLLSCFVIGTYRPLTGPPSWLSLSAILSSIVGSVVLLNLLSKKGPGRPFWMLVTQTLDVAAIVGLVIALDRPLGQQSWVLLVIPVVSAAVRHGSIASVLSWVGGCLGYVAAALSGLIESADDATLLARIPGTLLAVAITVGLLAQWMREGWELQNGLTLTVAKRENRLAVIEQTSHALKNLSTEEALVLCANQALALGFQAATVEHRSAAKPFAVGEHSIVARVPRSADPTLDGPVVTVWVEREQARVHSVAITETQSGSVITGWSERPIDEDHARSLTALVAQTSAAIETTMLLRQLRYTASHDSLTGLANRRTLDRELQQEARISGRLAVAFVDLDDFKAINDRFGHEVGDQALTCMARRLESAAGGAGLVARYGGDEFVIMLRGASSEEAHEVARSILGASADPITLGTTSVTLGVSIGISAASTPASPADLIRSADQALYRAKAAGKGTAVVADLDTQIRLPAGSVAG